MYYRIRRPDQPNESILWLIIICCANFARLMPSYLNASLDIAVKFFFLHVITFIISKCWSQHQLTVNKSNYPLLIYERTLSKGPLDSCWILLNILVEYCWIFLLKTFGAKAEASCRRNSASRLQCGNFVWVLNILTQTYWPIL